MRSLFCSARWTAALLLTATTGVLVQDGMTQTGGSELALVVVDSVPLPDGEIRGCVWLDAEQLVTLMVLPDTTTFGGVLQASLAFQDRYGNISRQEDFTGSLSRGLTFDGGCGISLDGFGVRI